MNKQKTGLISMLCVLLSLFGVAYASWDLSKLEQAHASWFMGMVTLMCLFGLDKLTR